MSDSISIRRARPSDAQDIIAFNVAIAKETEDLALNTSIVSKGVARLMENPQYGFYVVAESTGGVLGSLMVTYEWSDWRDGVYWWIQSVYVKPEHRGRGIYRQLHNFVRELAAKDPNARGLRLYVELENEVAQKAYVKMGMQPAAYKIYEEIFTR
jgi:ribosomal protein S18 acetylase RimI-like enzyme